MGVGKQNNKITKVRTARGLSIAFIAFLLGMASDGTSCEE